MARILIALTAVLLLSACASQIDAGVSAAPEAPGFWWGLWHGFIFPWSFLGSLFNRDIAVYAVPNKGVWYDFGYFCGICFLGGGTIGSAKARQ